MRYDGEGVLRKIADAYVKIEGERLLSEAQNLPQGTVTPALDRRVLAIPKKRARAYGAAGLAAACLALMLYLRQGAVLLMPKDADSGGAAPTAPAAMETVPLALSFELPDGYQVSAADYDNGASVYLIANDLGDDVTLVMEPSPGYLSAAGGAAITIKGKEALAVCNSGFSLLLIESDGLLYTLSCRYDINTLLPIGQMILS